MLRSHFPGLGVAVQQNQAMHSGGCIVVTLNRLRLFPVCLLSFISRTSAVNCGVKRGKLVETVKSISFICASPHGKNASRAA